MREYHRAFCAMEKGAGAGKSCGFRDVSTSCTGASAPVEPCDGEGFVGTELISWEGVLNSILCWPGMVIYTGVVSAGNGLRWFGNFQGGENGVENVATEISQGSVAEVLPISPAPWVVNPASTVGAHGSDADPFVPVQGFGNW